jgi:hypothetical protein
MLSVTMKAVRNLNLVPGKVTLKQHFVNHTLITLWQVVLLLGLFDAV